METVHGDSSMPIGRLAERTGVPAAKLRSWETRYGFPRPTRLPGGHRRYGEPDVAAVLEVVRFREAGLALDAAVRRATTTGMRSRSMYAELRRRHPELTPQLLSKASLLALSRAIEDECCAGAQEPWLFGGFQRERFLRASEARWAGLARTARATVVFAELAGTPSSGAPRTEGLVEVALPRDAPLFREWVIVCDAPDLAACLVAVERPGQESVPDLERRFEVVWTVDPRAVRHASRLAAALADEYRPGWRSAELHLPDDEPPAVTSELRRAYELLNRMMGYLDARG